MVPLLAFKVVQFPEYFMYWIAVSSIVVFEVLGEADIDYPIANVSYESEISSQSSAKHMSVGHLWCLRPHPPSLLCCYTKGRGSISFRSPRSFRKRILHILCQRRSGKLVRLARQSLRSRVWLTVTPFIQRIPEIYS